MAEYFNDKNEQFYLFIKKLWNNKLIIIILTIIAAISSITYSLLADQLYEVSAVIKPADTNEETSLETVSAFAGISFSGLSKDPVLKAISLTLGSDTFLDIFYKKYKFEYNLFGMETVSVLEMPLDSVEKELLIRERAIKILHSVIKYSIDNETNTVTIKIKLKDKYFAHKLMKELLYTTKMYIQQNNQKILEDDILYYQKILEIPKDPTIQSTLIKSVSNKIEKKYILSANVFTIVQEPYIPYKRVFPKRAVIVIISTFGAFVFSILLIMAMPVAKSILSIIKQK